MNFNLNIENINYIKIIYQDQDEFVHCAKAAIKRINEKDIFACAKYERDLFIKTPQEIDLSIACDNGLYKAKTTLKHVEKDEPYINFLLVTPSDIEYLQKREYFRVKINENALIMYDDKKISCITFDISANGVRFVLEEKISFPEEVYLIIHLPVKTIEVRARYVRTDEEDKILKASFSFIDLKESDLDYISQICLQKQLETRRKNLML